MAWIVTLKIVDCAAMSSNLVGARISSPILNAPGYVITDANGQAQIFDSYDTWEWVNVTISMSGTGGPCDPSYDPGYLSKNFVVHMDMDGTVQTVCLNKAPRSVCDPDAEPVSCFIVTAATGSASSFEVSELRALRERVRARSLLGAQLIEAIYAEYESFSPAIAARLQGDAASRGVVLGYIVRPLFAWYQLAGLLAFEPDAHEAQRKAARALAEACSQDAPGPMILDLLEGLRSGAPLPQFMPPMLHELGPRLGEFDFVPWAILDPLIRTWRAASDRGDPREAIAKWLAAAPLECLKPPEDSATLRNELATITGFLAFAPASRTALEKRLLAAWPSAAAEMAGAESTVQKESSGEF